MFTFHPSMHGELAQVAGMALFIFTKLDTAHNGRLVQPQSEILSEERVERRGEGRGKGEGEGGGGYQHVRTCRSHELYTIHHGMAKEEGGGANMQEHMHALMQGHTHGE